MSYTEKMHKALRRDTEGKENVVTDLLDEIDRLLKETLLLKSLVFAREQDLNELHIELSQLRERTRWIPVSERLPEDDYLVNVAFLYKNKIRTTSASHNNYGWYFDMEISGPTMLEDVTHWMPLPEPPEADDADN